MKFPITETLDRLKRYRTELSALDPSTHSCKQLRDCVSGIIYFIYSSHIDLDKYNSFARELEHDIAAIGINSPSSRAFSNQASSAVFISCKSEAELTLSSLIDSLLFPQSGTIKV
jgi:hypothetical protein